MNSTTSSIKLHGQWSSRFAFIMATTGAAVGLGNIWKFPYMAGNSGGSAFVILYLIFVATIGVPVMISEIMIGRRGRSNPVTSFVKLASQANSSNKWRFVGWLGAFTLLMVLAFYSVVAGWSLAYISRAASGIFTGASSGEILDIWGKLLSSPKELLLWHSLFMVITLFVIAAGVNKGLERASKILMPSLFVLLIVLVAYAAIIGDFEQALHFLFNFKIEDVNAAVMINAIGHAFFTLAVGACAMLVYGSYLDKSSNIPGTVTIIAVLDVVVALLAGLAIFPILFANGLSPEAGPGLMFKVLPIAFASIPAGAIVATAFFILLFFSAWSSSISMAEPLVVIMMEFWSISRLKATIITGVIAWTLGIFSVLSFNVWSDVEVFGKFGLFQVLADFPTNILLPLGGLLIAIFAGWIMHKNDTVAELACGSKCYLAWRFAIRYLAPIGIAVIFISNLV